VDKLAPPTDPRLVEALEMIAPGTLLRQSIDNIVRARTGALLIFADEAQVRPLISGGIDIDTPLKPMILYELAKMDGAVLLDRTGRHITHANVQLMPDASIDSQETGTRHRTAERVAKQLEALAISISAARDVVTVYVGDVRYIMDPMRVILSKADQGLQTLESVKNRLNQVAGTLSALEVQDRVTLFDVTSVLQRAEMVLSVSHLIEGYLLELGTEGRLVHLQMEELLFNVREDRAAVFADYLPDPTPARLEEAQRALAELPPDALVLMTNIGRILGYDPDVNVLETHVRPLGYRVLRKMPRLSSEAVQGIVRRFGGLQAVIEAPVEELAAIDGVGSSRAWDIKERLTSLRGLDVSARYG
jgi:diadenylate cyclase